MVAGIYSWSSGDASDSLSLIATVIVISSVFWAVFPRKYQVYHDHLRIVLGGPFSMKIDFDKIKRVEVTSTQAITMNFVTVLTKSYVEIVRKQGLTIAITPRANDLFVDNANRALNEWARQTRF